MRDREKVPGPGRQDVADPGPAAGALGSQVYRSSLALVVWWVWLAFAIGNLIDLAVQGRDHVSAEAAAALLVVTGIAYATALRPRVIASAQGITVRNPVRDHQIAWQAIARVDLGDLLRVHCAGPARGRVIQAWAIQASRRSRDMAVMRPGSGGLATGSRPAARTTPRAPGPGAVHRAETERIVRALNDRAEREQADREEKAASGIAPADPAITSRWHWPAMVAIAAPILLLIVMIFA
jgi:Bacterial PH domain